MKEVAWIEYKNKIIQFKIGVSATEVEFDLLDVWQEIIKYSTEIETISFCHTHPFEDKPSISEQDKKCIKSINLMFGDRFVYDFVIIGRKEYIVYNRFADHVDSGTIIPVDKVMMEISLCLE